MNSERFSALSSPAYRRYWLGSLASVGGTQLQIMGQGWLVYSLTGSTVMLGYLGAAAAIPAIVMTLFGGAVADRLNKKRLLTLTSVTTGCLMALLAVLDASNTVTAWHVIAIAATVSFVSGFDWPTRQTVFPLLIDRADMMSAVALNSIIWQSTRMIMPAIGGLLLAATGTAVLFAICASGFFIMAVVVATLPVDTPARRGISPSTTAQVIEGITYIVRNRIFLLLFTLSYGGMFFVSSYMQLMPAFSQLLDAGETGFGYLMSITGLGSITGTFLIGAYQRSRHLGLMMLATSLLSAAMLIPFALSAAQMLPLPFAMAMACAFLVAMFASMFMISSMTIMQLRVPEALRGRVMGLHGITYSLMPLGGLMLGYVASFSSAPVAIAISALVYVTLVIALAVTRSDLRRVDGTALASAG